MLIWRSLIVAGFLPDLLLVLAHTDHADFACGTLPSNDYREVSKRFAQEAKLDRRKLDRRYVQDIQVDVYIHVVARSERPADGYLNVGSFSFSDFLLPHFFCLLLTTPSPPSFSTNVLFTTFHSF